jgi:hypothetical protein
MTTPWMTNDEIELLEKYINKESIVLEYGSGSSTVWFAKRVHKLFSVEHHKQWYENINNSLIDSQNVEYYFIPPSKEWVDYYDGSSIEFYDYINKPLEKINNLDLCLVDGRARIDCCRAVIDKFPNCIIAFHDYNHRAFDNVHNYGEVLEFLEIIEKTSTIAIFKKK